MSAWDDYFNLCLDIGLTVEKAKEAADEVLFKHEEELNQRRLEAREGME